MKAVAEGRKRKLDIISEWMTIMSSVLKTCTEKTQQLKSEMRNFFQVRVQALLSSRRHSALWAWSAPALHPPRTDVPTPCTNPARHISFLDPHGQTRRVEVWRLPRGRDGSQTPSCCGARRRCAGAARSFVSTV
jgi:hypothetical protein